MIQVKKEGVVLESSGLGFDKEGVLNPAVILESTNIHMFYRAVAQGNYSSIGYCRMSNHLKIAERNDKPIIYPQADYESHGTEDPRIVKIEDLYYLSYTAYDGVNALGALAVSPDLKTFEKKGLVTPQIKYSDFKRLADSKKSISEKYIRYNKRESIRIKHHKPVFIWIKNVVFFPRKIKNKICFLLRIRPDIQVVMIEELGQLNRLFWEDYFYDLDKSIVLQPFYPHEVSYIGAGCPPIETEAGWLLIYHGVHDSPHGYIYSACAALLDINDPTREIARLPYPLFFPELEYELNGMVNNVCFPTGTVQLNDILYIYYGAADQKIACASVNVKELVRELLLNKVNNE